MFNCKPLQAGDCVRVFLLLFMKEDKKVEDRVVEFVGILWSIWLSRNNVAFNKVTPNPASIMAQSRSWKLSWKKSSIGLFLKCSQLPSKVIWKEPVRLTWECGGAAIQVPFMVSCDGALKVV